MSARAAVLAFLQKAGLSTPRANARIDQLLQEHAQGLRERLALVEALVSDFVDPDPCWFDHHGYCQAHGWVGTDPGCPHGRAKALGLEETEEDGS
ncbi:hypothetical protein [Streptomyces microflavus]|uniref:hypothetical protein n=1 Tax=Streptomyces microflavus TaxID=1919 RepID=UPI0033EFF83E